MLSPKQKCGCPALLALLARGRGFSADIAAANRSISAELLTTTGCPMRLNLYPAFSSGGIVLGAAPRPILGTRYQSALHWVLMYVFQLFHQLLFAIDVEVIVAGLPEGILGVQMPRPLAQNARRAGHPVLSVLVQFLRNICFSICSATARLLRSGSLSSRCTCSGMTTNPVTWNPYQRRTFSSVATNVSRACRFPRSGARRWQLKVTK
jgi:hypothetical protein